MVERLRPLILMFAAIAAGVVACQIPGQRASAVQDSPLVADLKDRLLSGLRVRTDQERAFIDAVVAKVENETIPRSLVDSTFLWVRTNKRNHDYPFFYFERILRQRGTKAGIEIPPFETPNFSPNR